jgi:hypothetical protein
MVVENARSIDLIRAGYRRFPAKPVNRSSLDDGNGGLAGNCGAGKDKVI